MTDLSIRVARGHESDACVDVYRAAWRGMAFVPQGLHTMAEDRRWMREVFARQLVLVAETSRIGDMDDAARIVGLLSMSEGTVHNLYIRPGYQNRGIGHRLIETAKTCSGGQLQLWVFEPNEGAIRFYQRHGFATVRKTDGLENEEKVPDRLMVWRTGDP
ncbi:MAG: GNAT family N-acetyltransferase [Alphaproteobacteria bacterium]|nr:GNAT family N-acetyltransferase [Alphaproteobacteria bacterium]